MNILKARFKFDIPPEGRKLTGAECKMIQTAAPCMIATPYGAWRVKPTNWRNTVMVHWLDKRITRGACGAGWHFINTNPNIETNPMDETALIA